MMCVECRETKPRTQQFCKLTSANKTTMVCKVGNESFSNYKSCPCRTCFKKMLVTNRTTRDGFLSRIPRVYSLFSYEWVEATLLKQNHRGLITNMVMNLTTNSPNCLGVHRKDHSLEHTPENCFFELQELNVPQHGNAIFTMPDTKKKINYITVNLY